MAREQYPMMGSRAWVQARTRVATTPSWKVTADSVAAAFGLKDAKSARQNVVTPLTRMGLIGEDGGLTQRGLKWRTEDGYAEACDEIVGQIYPESLTHQTNAEGEPDSEAVRRWFDQQGFGASAARQMAATFMMVARRQMPEVAPAKPGNGAKPAAKATKRVSTNGSSGAGGGSDRTKGTGAGSDQSPPPPPPPPAPNGPSLHLDIQIHIPPDASAEQLDHIFASMAKHLYRQ